MVNGMIWTVDFLGPVSSIAQFSTGVAGYAAYLVPTAGESNVIGYTSLRALNGSCVCDMMRIGIA